MTIEEPSYQVTKIMNFSVIEHPLVYSVILGRLALSMFRVITSIYHLMIKFLTEGRVRVLTADQEKSNRCYVTSLRGRRTNMKTYRLCLTQGKKKVSKGVH